MAECNIARQKRFIGIDGDQELPSLYLNHIPVDSRSLRKSVLYLGREGAVQGRLDRSSATFESRVSPKRRNQRRSNRRHAVRSMSLGKLGCLLPVDIAEQGGDNVREDEKTW